MFDSKNLSKLNVTEFSFEKIGFDICHRSNELKELPSNVWWLHLKTGASCTFVAVLPTSSCRSQSRTDIALDSIPTSCSAPDKQSEFCPFLKKNKISCHFCAKIFVEKRLTTGWILLLTTTAPLTEPEMSRTGYDRNI